MTTYSVLYFSEKCMVESPALSSSSSVVSPPQYPPRSTVPCSEAQLECMYRLCCSWWDGVQLFSLNLTQVARLAEPESPPPHASSPVCVW